MSCYVKSQKVKFSDERVIRSSVFTKMLFYPTRTEHLLEFNSYQFMNAPEPKKLFSYLRVIAYSYCKIIVQKLS